MGGVAGMGGDFDRGQCWVHGGRKMGEIWRCSEDCSVSPWAPELDFIIDIRIDYYVSQTKIIYFCSEEEANGSRQVLEQSHPMFT